MLERNTWCVRRKDGLNSTYGRQRDFATQIETALLCAWSCSLRSPCMLYAISRPVSPPPKTKLVSVFFFTAHRVNVSALRRRRRRRRPDLTASSFSKFHNNGWYLGLVILEGVLPSSRNGFTVRYVACFHVIHSFVNICRPAKVRIISSAFIWQGGRTCGRCGEIGRSRTLAAKTSPSLRKM